MANPIKQKFIEHMELYRLSKETQKGYIRGDTKLGVTPPASLQ